jgi:hypothetical protein
VTPYEIKIGKEANWDRYYPTDLQVVIDEHKQSESFSSSPEAKMTINAIAAHHPYKVRVAYFDEYREISDDKKELITTWAQMTEIQDSFVGFFGHEMLFKYGSTPFWFPIQSQLLPHFKKELKKGDEVDLYVMFVGTVWEAGRTQWVFIVNEFKKVRN